MYDGVPEEVVQEAKADLHETILGATPAVVTDTVSLGIPIPTAGTLCAPTEVTSAAVAANRADAVRVSTYVRVKGNVFMRWCLAAANRTPWPLLARRFFFARGDSKVGYCATMAVADCKYGLKLKSLQSSWALSVLLGKPPG